MPTCGYRVFPSTKGNKIKMEKNEATALAGGRDEASTNKKMCIDLATMPGTRQELSRARTTKKDDAYKFVILDATATFINLKFNFKVVKSLFFAIKRGHSRPLQSHHVLQSSCPLVPPCSGWEMEWNQYYSY